MDTIKAIIETPKGSGQKYDYDKKESVFKLKKILPQGMMFPYDYGYIPGTKGEDGDPLDILVVSDMASFPGCMIECRLIGAIIANQSGKKVAKAEVRNDRYIGIPVESSLFEKIKSIDALPKHVLKEIET